MNLNIILVFDDCKYVSSYDQFKVLAFSREDTVITGEVARNDFVIINDFIVIIWLKDAPGAAKKEYVLSFYWKWFPVILFKKQNICTREVFPRISQEDFLPANLRFYFFHNNTNT